MSLKLQLSEWTDLSADFELFLIYCHHKDYRLCLAINDALRAEFARIRDFPNGPEHDCEEKKDENDRALEAEVGYAQFKYVDDLSHRTFHLIANRPVERTSTMADGALFDTEEEQPLIPSLAKVDYFLKLEGIFEEHELNELEDDLALIPLIRAVKRVDPNSHDMYLNLMH